MPLERYDIAPHTIMPKHLLRETSAGTVVAAETTQPTQAETYFARICADEPHTLSGLGTVDGVIVQSGDPVLYAGDGHIYAASSGSWALASPQPSSGDTVLIGEGTRHAGTLHTVLDSGTERRIVHHATVILSGYNNPLNVDTTPQPIGCATVEVGGAELLQANPFQYSPRPLCNGLYTITAIVSFDYTGSPNLFFEIDLYVDNIYFATIDRRQAMANVLHFGCATMIRLDEGSIIDLRISCAGNATVIPAGTSTDARITITRVR